MLIKDNYVYDENDICTENTFLFTILLYNILWFCKKERNMQKKVYPQCFKDEVVKFYMTNHTIAETIKNMG